jgi:mersacidin/lichenicidin family type 2 lantibiotic
MPALGIAPDVPVADCEVKERAMSKQTIIRAWKDEEYRRNLSEAERAALPENPAGLIELTDAQLGAVQGGRNQITYLSHCNEACS